MSAGIFEWLSRNSPFRGSSSVYARARANVAEAAGREMPAVERYAVQRAYYANNRLYEDLARALYDQGIASRAVRGLRNPAFRITEFYPAVLWPGDLPDALPIKAENTRIVEPIRQIWKWSNWARKKQLYARWLAMLGDAFIKVVRPDDLPRVYFELIDPTYVTSFEVDERHNLTECRIDVEKQRLLANNVPESYTHTEVWSRAGGTYRRWEHRGDAKTPLEDLGPPAETRTFEQMGIDFVPIVHVPFMDVGELRGAGSFWFQLDKIDQINAEATRLSQMLFRHNKPTLAIVGGRDPSGRPLPPPRVAGSDGQTKDALELGDESVLSISGASSVASLVPNLQYDAHLKEIDALTIDLEQDRPEMAYWRVIRMEQSNVSGRALNYVLGPAIQRAVEVRGQGEDGMVRAMEMALSLAQVGDEAPFSGLGDYHAGDFEHVFERRPIIAVDDQELAQTRQVEASAFAALTQAGLGIEGALKLVFPELPAEELAALLAAAEKERQRMIEEQRLQFGAQQAARDAQAKGTGNGRGRGS